MTPTMRCAWKCWFTIWQAAKSGRSAGSDKGTAGNRLPVLLAASLFLALCGSVFGIDPNAGLPKPPEFTNDGQLESKYKSLTFEALKTQADQGSSDLQAELGRRYVLGQGTPTNTLLGFDWTRRAATSGLALAQFNLGRAYENGIGVSKDLKAAVEWYRRAVEQNLPSAAHQLAILTEQRALPEFEPKDSLRLYELAAEQGDLEAAYQLAQLYLNPPGGGEIKGSLAAYWFHFAATKGYLPAYANMGWLYLYPKTTGTFKDPDFAEAERWFRLGAERDEPSCEYCLARLELLRNKASPNLDEVRKWLTKAASKNYAAACYQLGQLSDSQESPDRDSSDLDLKEAVRWYQRATNLGHRRAAVRLVEIGLTGKVDLPQGLVDLLRQASDLGDPNASVELALRYHKGEARPRNEAESPLALIRSAASSGNNRAKFELFKLYVAGTYVHKDLVESMHWLFSAAPESDEAYEQILRLRSASNQRARPPLTNESDVQQAFDDYIAAVHTSKPEQAVKLARRYLDGTYPTNACQAAIWFSVASKRGDHAARDEAQQILATLNEADLKDVDSRVDRLMSGLLFQLPP